MHPQKERSMAGHSRSGYQDFPCDEVERQKDRTSQTLSWEKPIWARLSKVWIYHHSDSIYPPCYVPKRYSTSLSCIHMLSWQTHPNSGDSKWRKGTSLNQWNLVNSFHVIWGFVFLFSMIFFKFKKCIFKVKKIIKHSRMNTQAPTRWLMK